MTGCIRLLLGYGPASRLPTDINEAWHFLDIIHWGYVSYLIRLEIPKYHLQPDQSVYRLLINPIITRSYLPPRQPEQCRLHSRLSSRRTHTFRSKSTTTLHLSPSAPSLSLYPSMLMAQNCYCARNNATFVWPNQSNSSQHYKPTVSVWSPHVMLY